MQYNEQLPQNILYILQNKDQYTFEKLNEVLQWLISNNFTNESIELNNYITSLQQSSYHNTINQDYYNSQFYNNNQNLQNNTNYNVNQFNQSNIKYEGSKTSIWTTYAEIFYYITLIVITIAGAYIGRMLAYSDSTVILFCFIGCLIGFIVGFILIAPMMTYITLCENISTMTDNTAELLYKIDETNSLLAKDIDNISFHN